MSVNPDLAEVRAALERCWACGQTRGAVREAAEKGLAALDAYEQEQKNLAYEYSERE